MTTNPLGVVAPAPVTNAANCAAGMFPGRGVVDNDHECVADNADPLATGDDAGQLAVPGARRAAGFGPTKPTLPKPKKAAFGNAPGVPAPAPATANGHACHCGGACDDCKAKVLANCGGKGGQPGPCPTGGKPVNPGNVGPKQKKAVEATGEAFRLSQATGAGSDMSRDAKQIHDSVSAVMKAGKSLSVDSHDQLAKIHDSLAQRHYNARDRFENSGVYGEDTHSGQSLAEKHEAAAYAHQNAAEHHRTAFKARSQKKSPAANEAAVLANDLAVLDRIITGNGWSDKARAAAMLARRKVGGALAGLGARIAGTPAPEPKVAKVVGRLPGKGPAEPELLGEAGPKLRKAPASPRAGLGAGARKAGFKDAADERRFHEAGRRQDVRERAGAKAPADHGDVLDRAVAGREKVRQLTDRRLAKVAKARKTKVTPVSRLAGARADRLAFSRNAAAPSEGLDMTADKACKIVKDKQVHGRKLTDAQRGMFGAKCGTRGKVQNAQARDEHGRYATTAAARSASSAAFKASSAETRKQGHTATPNYPASHALRAADNAVEFGKLGRSDKVVELHRAAEQQHNEIAARHRKEGQAAAGKAHVAAARAHREAAAAARRTAMTPLKTTANAQRQVTNMYRDPVGNAGQPRHLETGQYLHAWHVYNRAWPQARRDKLPAEDFAGPGRSFPIATQEDLDAAVRSVGRSKHSPAVIEAGIRRIAKRKGLTLPDAWQDDGDGDEPAANANPEGHNQYTNRGAAAASRKAHAASQATEGLKETSRQNEDAAHARKMSGYAISSSDQQRHASAKDAHQKASEAHSAAANYERERGYNEAADAHEKASQLHGASASYRHSLLNNRFSANQAEHQSRHLETGQYLPTGGRVGAKQVHTAARQGAEHLGGHELAPEEDPDDDGDLHPEIGQGDRPAEPLALDATGRATGRKVTNMYRDPGDRTVLTTNFNPCHDALGLFCHAGSTGAANASRLAAHSGKASDHKRAAAEHTKAAAHHREEGNEEVAQLHEAAAKHHARTAKGATHNARYRDPASTTHNHEVPMTLSRTDALGVLTANCACEADAAALNALGDDTLGLLAANVLLANDKAEGSNADVTGGGTDQAGGEEDTYSDDDDMAEDAMAQVKRKTPKGVTGNAEDWWAAAPAGFREQYEEGQLALNERKLEVVQRLVANVADRGRRHELGNRLLRLPLADLRERLELLPAPAANARPAGGPNFAGIGTGGVGTPYGGGPTHPHFQPQLFRDPGPVSYLGAGAPGGPAPVGNAAPDEGLPLPKIDWAEVAREQRQERHTA